MMAAIAVYHRHDHCSLASYAGAETGTIYVAETETVVRGVYGSEELGLGGATFALGTRRDEYIQRAVARRTAGCGCIVVPWMSTDEEGG